MTILARSRSGRSPGPWPLTDCHSRLHHDGVTTIKRPSLPPGRQPWDPANGVRVGVLIGGLFGAALVSLSGIWSFWIVAACGAIGGGIGYWSEKRKQGSPAGGSGQSQPQDC